MPLDERGFKKMNLVGPGIVITRIIKKEISEKFFFKKNFMAT